MNKYIRKFLGSVFQSQQTQQPVLAPSRHSPTSPEEWRQHWQSQGQPWRTEPEIDAKRQAELAQRRAVVPNMEEGIYPFKGVKLNRADEEADLSAVWGKGVNLSYAQLEKANLYSGYLENANLFATQLQKADLGGANLKSAMLGHTQLEGADLAGADLEDANLNEARLIGADLRGVNFERANLNSVQMMNTDLRGAYFERSILNSITLGDGKRVGPLMADVQWNTVNLTVVNWSQVIMLGDDHEAKQRKNNGKVKDKGTRIKEYGSAVRANRQLAVALQGQGLDEEANRFAYRAQVLQRKLLWKQRNFWKWLGSAMLALLGGYGYRMWHILVTYLVIVLLCAVTYFVLGMYYGPHLSLLEAILTSITAFHGRVFSEPFLQPSKPQLWVTAFEAVAGLVIEGVFIAMLTQKFFGK